MDGAKVIESVLTDLLKPVGFRKRGRNWYRHTPTEIYQIVNLQRSPWGGGDCYLNLAWDPDVPARDYRSEGACIARFRAEQVVTMPPIELLRADGVSVLEMPGISLLDRNVFERYSDLSYREDVRRIVAEPTAALLERTASVAGLVQLYEANLSHVTQPLRERLARLDFLLPEPG